MSVIGPEGQRPGKKVTKWHPYRRFQAWGIRWQVNRFIPFTETGMRKLPDGKTAVQREVGRRQEVVLALFTATKNFLMSQIVVDYPDGETRLIRRVVRHSKPSQS